jgi:hypothetical protein
MTRRRGRRTGELTSSIVEPARYARRPAKPSRSMENHRLAAGRRGLPRAGIDGIPLSFYDFKPDLDFFGQRALPLLREADALKYRSPRECRRSMDSAIFSVMLRPG